MPWSHIVDFLRAVVALVALVNPAPGPPHLLTQIPGDRVGAVPALHVLNLETDKRETCS